MLVRRLLTALLSGVLITLSFSPVDLWPAGLVGIAGLYLAIRGLNGRRAAWVGWVFGCGLFGSGTSWVWVSIATYGNVGPVIASLITLLFIAVLALFPAVQCGLMQRYFGRHTNPLIFSACWLLSEWLRGWLFTGFPWLYLGYAHIHSPLAGFAPVFGVLGLSFVTAVIGSTLAYLLLVFRDKVWRGQQRRILLTGLPLLAILTAALPLLMVDWVSPRPGDKLTVGIVHGIIPQDEKFEIAMRLSHVEYFESLSDELWGRDIIVWPETAIAFFHHRATPLLNQLNQHASREGSTLISGIFHSGERYVHNSILALGQGAGLYHKQKLVPFGEYVPLRGLIGPLFQLFDLPMSDIGPGPTNQDGLMAGEHQLAPFICYEIAYPDFVRRHAPNSDLLVTISNDTWFGSSWGPPQHLQIAAMRALENGRYLLRSTNNGLSAIVDQRGHIISQSTQFDPQVLQGEVTLFQGRTPFSRWGSWPVLLLSLSILALSAAHIRRTSPSRPQQEPESAQEASSR